MALHVPTWLFIPPIRLLLTVLLVTTFGYYTICSPELFCPFVLFNFGGLAGWRADPLTGNHWVHQLTVPLLLLPCIQITTPGTVTVYYLCAIWYIVPYPGITTVILLLVLYTNTVVGHSSWYYWYHYYLGVSLYHFVYTTQVPQYHYSNISTI